MTVEQRTVQHLIPVGLGLTVQQQVDGVVALTVQRREDENQRTQDSTTKYQFDIWLVLEASKHILTGIHHADEVQRYQSTRHTQQKTRWHTLHRPVGVQMEREHHCIAAKNVRETRCRHTRYQNG